MTKPIKPKVETKARYRIRGPTSPCPYCGDRGPHDDNGATGYERTFMCTKCKELFDAIPI